MTSENAEKTKADAKKDVADLEKGWPTQKLMQRRKKLIKRLT